MRKSPVALPMIAVLALSVTGCGSDDAESEGDTASADGVCADTDAADDLLAEICDKGTLTVSTDPAYPPQSSLNEETGELEGFDIDVATEIANRLGVEVAWQEPSWDVITAGSWNGRWDVSVGSMTPTNDRQQVLHFTPPYYYAPAVVVVHSDNTSITDLSTDLDGKDIGVCGACTYEHYLEKSLDIEGFEFDFVVDDAVIRAYDTDTTALQDLSLGDGTRLDAVITTVTTAQGFVDGGAPAKIVGNPVFYEPLSVGIDKSAPQDPTSLVDALSQIVEDMHADGTLTALSEEWYDGLDLTVQQ